MQFMHANNVYLGIPNVFNLIVTIPAVRHPPQSAYFLQKMDNDLLPSNTKAKKNSSHTLMSIEKVLLTKVKCEPNFYDLVIENFVTKIAG